MVNMKAYSSQDADHTGRESADTAPARGLGLRCPACHCRQLQGLPWLLRRRCSPTYTTEICEGAGGSQPAVVSADCGRMCVSQLQWVCGVMPIATELDAGLARTQREPGACCLMLICVCSQ